MKQHQKHLFSAFKMARHIKKIVLAFLVIISNSAVSPHSSGAPTSVCSSMVPDHRGTAPQTGLNPYTVKLHKSTSKQDIIKITLASHSVNDMFRGFLIQVRAPGGNKTFGEFKHDSEELQTLDCFRMRKSAITHSSNGLKMSVSVQWTPPTSDSDKEYQVYYSVVKNISIYWANVRHAEKILIAGKSRIIAPSRDLLGKWNEVYSDCGRTKGCFGVPSNCVRNYDPRSINPSTCDMLVTWTTGPWGSISFSLTGRILSNVTREQGYLALGFSKENYLEEQSIVGCAFRGGVDQIPKMQRYFNPKTITKNLDSNLGLETLEASNIESNIFCKFTHSTRVPELNLDLYNDKYFVTLSRGTGVADTGNALSRHPATEEKGRSPQAVYMTAPNIIGANARRRPVSNSKKVESESSS